MLIALWNRGEVVSTPVTRQDPERLESTPTVVFDDAVQPQHLTVFGDELLLTDHSSGRILALSPVKPPIRCLERSRSQTG